MPMTIDFPHDELTAVAATALRHLHDTPGLGDQLRQFETIILLEEDGGRFGMAGGAENMGPEDAPQLTVKMMLMLIHGLKTICRVYPQMKPVIVLTFMREMSEP